MAKKKEDTIEDTNLVEIVVDKTPAVEAVEVDRFPGHNTRAFRQ